MIKNKITPGVLLVILILIETFCYTYLVQTPLYFSTSVLYFLAGFGICFLPFFSPEADPAQGKRILFIPVAFWLIISGLLLFSLPRWFNQIPIDYHLADMLPRIKIYAARFLNSSYVYDDVKEIWGGNLPPYFPATWMPFIPAVIWNFEMRWITVAAFVIGMFPMLLLIKWSNDKRRNVLLLFMLGSFFILMNFHVTHAQEFWTMGYEGLIAAYYIFLCLALISWNPYLIGVAISFCLLSRFSLSFWVPFFVLFLWWKESFQFVVKVSGVIAVLILGLFILPFVVGHVDVFLKTLDQYQMWTQDFWRVTRISERMYKEVGFYKFFNVGQIQLMRHLQLGTTILAPLIFLALAARYSSFFKNRKMVGLCSLKFTLLFFYNFVDMPFHYLFMTPTIISYVIGFYYLSGDKEGQGTNSYRTR